MSRVMELQAWRPAARVERSSPESRAKAPGGRFVALQKVPPESSVAWDPYEVWLTRVKQPRDRSERGSS
jgi:hypothetical protein